MRKSIIIVKYLTHFFLGNKRPSRQKYSQNGLDLNGTVNNRYIELSTREIENVRFSQEHMKHL